MQHLKAKLLYLSLILVLLSASVPTAWAVPITHQTEVRTDEDVTYGTLPIHPSPEMQDDTGADLEEQTSDDPLHVTLVCPAENKEYDLCYRSVANGHYGWNNGGSPSTMGVMWCTGDPLTCAGGFDNTGWEVDIESGPWIGYSGRYIYELGETPSPYGVYHHL
ncbi:MAG: hypothetical protein DRH56_10580, partial [Deltaproteobacteria bacterium]